RISVGLQSESEKPIISQCAAQAHTQSVAFTVALIPIVYVILTELIVAGKSATAIFVTETYVAIELNLGNRRRELPFSSSCAGRLFHQLGAHLLGFLVSDEPFANEQIEQRACVLPSGGGSSKCKKESDG